MLTLYQCPHCSGYKETSIHADWKTFEQLKVEIKALILEKNVHKIQILPKSCWNCLHPRQ